MTLGEVLADPAAFERGGSALFLPPDRRSWALGSPATVIDLDECEEEVEEVERRTGSRYVFLASQVIDIVENARMQRCRPTPEQLTRAFLFYFDRDAFIDFDAEPAW